MAKPSMYQWLNHVKTGPKGNLSVAGNVEVSVETAVVLEGTVEVMVVIAEDSAEIAEVIVETSRAVNIGTADTITSFNFMIHF